MANAIHDRRDPADAEVRHGHPRLSRPPRRRRSALDQFATVLFWTVIGLEAVGWGIYLLVLLLNLVFDF